MFALSVIGAVYVVAYFQRKYSQKHTAYLKYFLISQSIWLLWVISKAAYYYIIFETASQFEIYSEIMNAVFNLATLSTVLNSAAFLLMFTNRRSDRWLYASFSLLILLHIILSGALYLDYFRFEGTFTEEIKMWNKLAIAWIIFMFIFNLLPSFFVSSALMRFGEQKSDWWSRALELHRINSKFTYMTLAQIFGILAYAVCAGLKTTSALGNDRSWLAMDGVLCFFLVWHSILNCLFIENVSYISQLRSKTGFTKSTLAKAASGTIFTKTEDAATIFSSKSESVFDPA